MSKTMDEVFADIHEQGELQRVRSAQKMVLEELCSIKLFCDGHNPSHADLVAMAAFIARTDKGISFSLLMEAWSATRS